MTRIYLIRAAHSEGHPYRIAQGHCDGNLTELGWQQVKGLGQRFADIAIDAVYTSDLYRARATAGALHKPGGLPVYPLESLREIGLGSWDGLPWGNIAYKEAKQVENFHTDPENWQAEGAETPEQVLQRMLAALRQIAADNPGKAVAVISHGYAIRLLLADLQGLPWQSAHQLPMPQHTAVSIIEAEGDALTLVESDKTEASESTRTDTEQPEFSTDLYIHPLPWIEYGDIFAGAVEFVWEEAAEDRPFDRLVLMNGLGPRTTYVGFMEYNPVSFLQLGSDPGWITLILTHPGCRKLGLGTQLIGQAVCAARASGLDYLRVALPKQNPHRAFFTQLGFKPAGTTQEGREVLQKDIGFLPEYVATDNADGFTSEAE